ncbi:hypothetical protein GGI43DRAFT_412166 [Trichoderma evansii]
MHFHILFAPIALIALPQVTALAMPEGDLATTINSALEDYDITLDYNLHHDFNIFDLKGNASLTIPGVNLKDDHVEVPVRVEANAGDAIHLNELFPANIYYKNEWTRAFRWEASFSDDGPALYVDLETQFIRSNCKLGLRLHIIGKGILEKLDEDIDLVEVEQDAIKALAKENKLCDAE